MTQGGGGGAEQAVHTVFVLRDLQRVWSLESDTRGGGAEQAVHTVFVLRDLQRAWSLESDTGEGGRAGRAYCICTKRSAARMVFRKLHRGGG